MPGQSQPAAQPAGRSLLRSLFILDVERLTGPTSHAPDGSILYCIDSADVRVAVLLPQLDPYFWFPAPAEVKSHSDADSVAVINALTRVRQCCGQHELDWRRPLTCAPQALNEAMGPVKLSKGGGSAIVGIEVHQRKPMMWYRPGHLQASNYLKVRNSARAMGCVCVVLNNTCAERRLCATQRPAFDNVPRSWKHWPKLGLCPGQLGRSRAPAHSRQQ